jgi:hypothetical protein
MYRKSICFLIGILYTSSFVVKKNISEETEEVKQPYNFIPNVINIPWYSEISVLNYCLVNDEEFKIHEPVIETAFDVVNSYLYNGLNTPLFLNYISNDTSLGCDHYINITSDSYIGFCTREFITNNNVLAYIGCSITLNACNLQTAAVFYNVLLHELLHVVGLDHPVDISEESIMGYRVSVNEEGEILYDDRYSSVSLYDIQDIFYIIMRDFPNKKLPNYRYISKYEPLYPPSRHISGNNKSVIDTGINYYKDICESETFSPTKSPTSSSSPTKSPTSSSSPTKSPTSSSSPTKSPTSSSSPTKSPTKRKRKGKGKGKKGKGKGKGNGKKGELNINTRVSPEIGISEGTDITNINSRIKPIIDIDTSKSIVSEFNIKTDVSPEINIIGGPNQNFNVYTDVTPVIRLGTSSMEKDKSPHEWDKCFFC